MAIKGNKQMNHTTQSWLTTNNIIPLVGMIITLVTVLVNASVNYEKQNSKIDMLAQKLDQVIEGQKQIIGNYHEVEDRLGRVELVDERYANQISSILTQIKNLDK